MRDTLVSSQNLKKVALGWGSRKVRTCYRSAGPGGCAPSGRRKNPVLLQAGLADEEAVQTVVATTRERKVKLTWRCVRLSCHPCIATAGYMGIACITLNSPRWVNQPTWRGG